MVGRDREQRLLSNAWERVVSERSCHLVTVLGNAGVGKSRLAAEFLGPIDRATIARGRCLPYGEGITYWPVIEVLKQLPEVELDENAAETIRGLLGDEAVTTSSERIASAFRQTLEAVSVEQPLICVLDDLHWGEEHFLDLVEDVADLSRDAPILLLCMARPELLERRSGWAGGKVNATNVLLEPLGPEDTELLIQRLANLEHGLRSRIREAAEGNPLFVEEMIALAQESADGEVMVPPTIQALLAARIDQLAPEERDLLQCGSVEGRVFHRGAVQALAPEAAEVSARLTGLVRKELIRPGKPQVSGEDAYRFRHLLIRDAAYDSLPKATRAVLHQRFANWLAGYGEEIVELDEIVGYHLEQAWRYRSQLGEADDATRTLGREAARRLAASGSRAFMRKDGPAAMNLISRAAALLSADDPARVELVPNVRVMQGMGGDLDWTESILSEALQGGDEQLKAHALVQRGLLRLFTERDVTSEELIADAEQAITVFQSHGDELGLARGWRLVGQAHYLARHAGPSADAAERALAHARRAGDPLEVKEIVEWLSVGLTLGPTPAAEALQRIEPLLKEASQDGLLLVTLCSLRANLTAMCGQAAEARELFAQARRAIDDRERQRSGYFAIQIGLAQPMLGDSRLAEEEQRAACAVLEELGEKTNYSSVAVMLARTLCAQGRYAEAERYTRVSEEAAGRNDVLSQILWRSIRAKALAHREEFGAAEGLAHEAVQFAGESDFLNAHADALMDLAEVSQLAGKFDEAAPRVRQALDLYERKGNLVMAERAQTRFDEMSAAHS